MERLIDGEIDRSVWYFGVIAIPITSIVVFYVRISTVYCVHCKYWSVVYAYPVRMAIET